MRRRAQRRPAAGFTYLVLLFALALGGAALAALGPQWQTLAQREREAELLFRGLQYRDALQRFHDQTPPGQPALPQTLDELLADRRQGEPRHHLRRLYPDPFTGAADWVLLRAADGGITGLHSRSNRLLLQQQRPAGSAAADEATARPGAEASSVGSPDAPARARDWRFGLPPDKGPHGGPPDDPAAGRPAAAPTGPPTARPRSTA